MWSTSIFPCIMTIISNFTIFFIFQLFIFKFFFTNITFLHFLMIPTALFVNNFIFFFLKLVIFNACFLKDSQNFFIQSLPLYTSCLFSMLLNKDIVDIEKPDEMFVYFCCRSIFRIISTSINLFYYKFQDLHKKQIKAYSSSLLHVIIAHSHLLSFKIFSDFVCFCTNFQIFCPFSEKSLACPLLSRIGPANGALSDF